MSASEDAVKEQVAAALRSPPMMSNPNHIPPKQFGQAFMVMLRHAPVVLMKPKYAERIMTASLALKKASNDADLKLKQITDPATTEEDNARWDTEYDGKTRGELLNLLGAMAVCKELVVQRNSAVNGLIEQMMHDFCERMRRAQAYVNEECIDAQKTYEQVMMALHMYRKKREVRNLGPPAPSELTVIHERCKGRFHPPKGFAEQFNKEWLALIPANEHDYNTATEKALVGVLDSPVRKWCHTIASEMKAWPDQLPKDMVLCGVLLTTYAPGCKLPAAMDSEFYKQQFADSRWYSREWIKAQFDAIQVEDEKKKEQVQAIKAKLLQEAQAEKDAIAAEVEALREELEKLKLAKMEADLSTSPPSLDTTALSSMSPPRADDDDGIYGDDEVKGEEEQERLGE